MKLKLKKLFKDVQTPKYATEGSACFDIHAHIDNADQASSNQHTVVTTSKVFNTGLIFDVPEKHVMLVFSRSGHGFNSDIRLANCVGVIDSDYRGELKVKLTNDGPGYFVVKHGERIAQAMLMPIEQVEFEDVDEVTKTSRGAGGLGSTGS